MVFLQILHAKTNVTPLHSTKFKIAGMSKHCLKGLSWDYLAQPPAQNKTIASIKSAVILSDSLGNLQGWRCHYNLQVTVTEEKCLREKVSTSSPLPDSSVLGKPYWKCQLSLSLHPEHWMENEVMFNIIIFTASRFLHDICVYKFTLLLIYNLLKHCILAVRGFIYHLNIILAWIFCGKLMEEKRL